jgi:hypothetical protein
MGAPINRYDTPAQASFINTYVPIPFERLMAIDQMKQAKIEENDKLTDETLAAINAIKVAPADEQAYLDKANSLKTQVMDIMNSSAPGSYEGKRKLMNLRNQVQVDPTLRSMVQNYSTYSDAMTQKQEADKEGTISANQQPLNEIITNLSSGGKGTLGYMKETGGSGVYSRGSWMKNVNVKKAMEQYVNNVPESSIEQAGVVAKDGNKYILETGSAGTTLNALGAPLGIRFATNEKGEQTIDLKNSNISIFLDTPEGKQIQNIARERVRTGQAKDVNQEVQRQYYEHALSAINERVSSKSTVKLAADPFDQARYKKELDDKVNPWSTTLSIATSGSKLMSFNKTEEAKTTIGNQIEKGREDLEQFRTLYGVKDVVTTSKDGQTSTTRVDKNGVDVSEAYDLKAAEIKQLEDQKKSIDDMVARVKGEIGIPSTWKPNEDVKAGAEKVRAEAEQKALLRITNDQNRVYTEEYKQNPTPEERMQAKEEAQPAYDNYIQKNDATWNKLNQALKVNAAKSSVITTATKFGSKELNERAVGEFPLLMENEVQWVGNKKSLSVKEKESLGSMSAKSGSQSDPTKVVFGGSLVDPESQKIKFVYQTYDKNGKLSDPFMVDAPNGVVDDLIRTGATSQAKVMIHQQLTKLETNPDNTTSVTLGTGEQTKGVVRKTSVTGDPLKPKWLLTVNLRGPKGESIPTEKIFDSRTALIDYYEAFVITELKNRK